MKQEWLYHNSHNSNFRAPFGAVSCGTSITLRLKVSAFEQPNAIHVHLWHNATGEKLHPMVCCQQECGEFWYECKITAPETPGLLWYHFQVSVGGKLHYYGANTDGYGGSGQRYDYDPRSYQITVHQADLRTPQWFKDAIVYQIFVDRFHNGNPDQQIQGLRPGNLVHAFWEDIPFYVRDMRNGHIFAYDFFGGNLAGVIKKLPMLKELGITAIYFNPIFEAPSNHKYDTADYKKIDPMFGDNNLFRELCTEAARQGIRVILDGVFSHTGSDSIYFNKDGNYKSLGAYQSTASPYYSWYRFTQFPDNYESWWGIGTLPNVNEMEPSYLDFIMHSDDSVVNHWSAHGIKGWRLDVADELPDAFIKQLRCAVKKADPDAVLIGEVWEDASRKVSYGTTREYLLGEELDSVMNYPFRSILLEFFLGHIDAGETCRRLTSLYENYPREHFFSTLNIVGGHDVPRILTLLGEAPPAECMTIIAQARYRLPPDKKGIAIRRLKLLLLWQMTFPGVPSIYYGDEAGAEGYTDPFNRGTYPWGKENQELLSWCHTFTSLRQRFAVLRTGEWVTVPTTKDIYCFIRFIKGGRDALKQSRSNNVAIVIINRSSETAHDISIDVSNYCRDYVWNALENRKVYLMEGRLATQVGPLEGKLYLQSLEERDDFPRSSGVLLHPTSLPSPYGIGDLGPEAYKFIDWLADSKQKLWQVLPLNPPDFAGSPYQSYSAFAGNTLLISPQVLIEDGLLDRSEAAFSGVIENVDFVKVSESKYRMFELAFDRFKKNRPSNEYKEFLAENALWLDNYALFMALKEEFKDKSWLDWDEAIASRTSEALKYYEHKLSDRVEFHRFLQFEFFRQWHQLKLYANQKGIQIVGDLPIFVSFESSDVWANRHLFALQADFTPSAVAGVPPDYFSETGQLWGNPHYKWDVMVSDDYLWWRERIKHLLKQTDLIRIDHFRGFDAFWAVDPDESTAIHGKWVQGPGAKFFSVLEEHLGRLPIIAEDLGVITTPVEILRDMFNYPGMKILHFLFEGGHIDIDMANTVVYTGTHDNDTTAGWYQKSTAETKLFVQKKLGLPKQADDQDVCWPMIEFAMKSAAGKVIIPLQDILCLDSDARMNTPGTIDGNWNWRYRGEWLSQEVAKRLADLTEKYLR